jgi:hypothetical protein
MHDARREEDVAALQACLCVELGAHAYGADARFENVQVRREPHLRAAVVQQVAAPSPNASSMPTGSVA